MKLEHEITIEDNEFILTFHLNLLPTQQENRKTICGSIFKIDEGKSDE